MRNEGLRYETVSTVFPILYMVAKYVNVAQISPFLANAAPVRGAGGAHAPLTLTNQTLLLAAGVEFFLGAKGPRTLMTLHAY